MPVITVVLFIAVLVACAKLLSFPTQDHDTNINSFKRKKKAFEVKFR